MRVEVSTKFASMPTRTAVHTFTVNSTPCEWDMFHLIRSISMVKGLCRRRPGHMVRTTGRSGRATSHDFPARLRNEFELMGVLPRTGPKGLARFGGPLGSPLLVKVYADLNTFSKALVPQSE